MADISLDKVITFIAEELGQRGTALSAMEKIILEAAWNDLTYSQMSGLHDVNLNTLNGRTAPRLWKKLTPIFDQKVGKKTFRKLITLKLVEQSELTHGEEEAPLLIGASLPSIENFIGRDNDVAHLIALVNKFPFVLLLGLEGIGKKTLVAKAIGAGDNFPLPRVFWKPLHHQPSPKELEHELLSTIGAAEDDELIERLQAEPFLIVLESLDALLSTAGSDQSLDPLYVSLFRRITEETPSKIIATSTQTIKAIENLVLRGQAILHNISGVKLAEAEAILGSHWNAQATEDVWKAVGGNPRMLKELSAWSKYADGLTPETDRLSVISALVGNFYEKILQSTLLSTSDMTLLKIIAEDTKVPFSKFLAKRPKAMPDLKRLIDMGLVKKDYIDAGDTVYLMLDPLLERALKNQG